MYCNTKSEYKMMQILKKLWFGEYSLSKSYWFFGNIVPLIFFIFLILFALFCQNDPLDSLLNLKFVPPELYQKSIVLFFCLIFLIYTVVSTVGIWKSANKHKGGNIGQYSQRLQFFLQYLVTLRIFINFSFNYFKVKLLVFVVSMTPSSNNI